MTFIDSLEDLLALYGTPGPAATQKVASHLTDDYRRWIMAARFLVLTTVGPEGSDGSPRGDDGPVVQEIDPGHLALPDWAGNNRIDSLRNIVRDPRVSLMFMVPGSNNVVRVNGLARLSADPDLLARFDRDGKRPRSVIVVETREIYFQCARALMRSALWTSGDQSAGLPTPGGILARMTKGEVGGDSYDAAWPERARQTMW